MYLNLINAKNSLSIGEHYDNLWLIDVLDSAVY